MNTVVEKCIMDLPISFLTHRAFYLHFPMGFQRTFIYGTANFLNRPIQALHKTEILWVSFSKNSKHTLSIPQIYSTLNAAIITRRVCHLDWFTLLLMLLKVLKHTKLHRSDSKTLALTENDFVFTGKMKRCFY